MSKYNPAPLLDQFIAERYKEGNARDVMKSGLRKCICALVAESGSLETDDFVPGAVVTMDRIRAAAQEAMPGKGFANLLRDWCIYVALHDGKHDGVLPRVDVSGRGHGHWLVVDTEPPYYNRMWIGEGPVAPDTSALDEE